MNCIRCDRPALFKIVLRDGPRVTGLIPICRQHTGLALQFLVRPGQHVTAQIERVSDSAVTPRSGRLA